MEHLPRWAWVAGLGVLGVALYATTRRPADAQPPGWLNVSEPPAEGQRDVFYPELARGDCRPRTGYPPTWAPFVLSASAHVGGGMDG